MRARRESCRSKITLQFEAYGKGGIALSSSLMGSFQEGL